LGAVLAANVSAVAAEISGLYEAQVPVASQDAAERGSASLAALEEVLVKVTGSTDVLQRPEIKPLLDQAGQLVQRYQYRAAQPPLTPPPAMAGSKAPVPAQMLWVAFDRQTINHRLAEAGLPVWGIDRPRTLVWLAVEDGGERYLVGGDNRPDLQQMLNDQARRRGLPLSVPLMDLQDQGGLAAADVWGDFPDAILRASDRYQPEAVLVGRVYTVAPDKWQSHWSLYHRGTAVSWESAEGSENDAVAAGIAGAADHLAKRYALVLTADAANSMTLAVENIATVDDYARALRYLQSLDPVAAVQIARVEGDVVSYRLKVRGEVRDVLRSIGWGKTLTPAEQGGAPSSGVPATDEGAAEHPADGVYRYRIMQ
jgi:hypothetical protein